MLKPPSLITKDFNTNMNTQEKLFKNMCNFGAWEEWRNGRRATSSYIDVEISNNQCRLVNTTPFYCITVYIMEYAIDDKAFDRLPQKSINIIDGDFKVTALFFTLLNGFILSIKQTSWHLFYVIYSLIALGKRRIVRREQYRKSTRGIINLNRII